MHATGSPNLSLKSGTEKLRQQCCFPLCVWQEGQKFCKHPHGADGSTAVGSECFLLKVNWSIIESQNGLGWKGPLKIM